MDEVRRATDDELCGYVAELDGRWQALTVFGAVLSEHPVRGDAVEAVIDDGLASLADRWSLRRPDGSTEIVCIVEAHPGAATLALDFYATPGVPTLVVTAAQLAAGEWRMTR